MAVNRTAKSDALWLRSIDAVSEVSGYLSGVCILASTLIICQAVIVRALGGTTIWQTELSVYLLMFVTFIGGAYGLKHGHHVAVDILLARFSGRARYTAQLVAAGMSLTIIVVVGWRSYEMWQNAAERGWTSGTAWDPPLILPYAILPLGMALIALQYVAIITRTVQAMAAGSQGAADHDGEGGRGS